MTSTYSILLVEDTAVLAEQIADILRMEGYEVVIAANGVEALAKLRTFRPRVVVTDVLMPEMDGFELISHINQVPDLKSIPVIVLTAKSEEETDGRLSSLGVASILRKPCEADDLLQALDALDLS